jgi:cell division septation protein DedD
MAGNKAIDTEITLGIGKLLGLFFGLVILCGISLGVGYSLGRNSARQAVGAAAVAPPAPVPPTPSSANKPGAAQTTPPKAPDCTAANNCATQADTGTSPANLTFYDTVQQKKAEHPQLTPAEPVPSPSAAPVQPRTTLGGGYLVQIAAVRNQDDARSLSDALRKRQYPVIIAQPGDKLFHVQVGPYADVKEAEAIRSRLVGEGYNAFLKR